METINRESQIFINFYSYNFLIRLTHNSGNLDFEYIFLIVSLIPPPLFIHCLTHSFLTQSPIIPAGGHVI